MSEPDLEAIRARKDAASQGPWAWFPLEDWRPLVDGNRVLLGPAGEQIVIYSQSTVWCDDADAEFIAASRTDVDDLLEAIDRLRSMLIDAETEAQMQAAEVERLRAADGIVRNLAAARWVYDHIGCFQCGAMVQDGKGGAPSRVVEPHDDDCVYALALAYVEANPA